MIKSFRDLEAWHNAHQLVIKIYQITKGFPAEERFGLISQLQRAVVSITCNIAEGFSRYYFKDRMRFYYQARGSIGEVENLLLIAKDIGYLKNEIMEGLLDELEKVNTILNGLIKKTNEMTNS